MAISIVTIMQVTHCELDTALQLQKLTTAAYKRGLAGQPLRTYGCFLPSRSARLVEKAYEKGAKERLGAAPRSG